MNKANPQQHAAKLLAMFFQMMNITGITNIESTEAALQKGEYVIEEVLSNESVKQQSIGLLTAGFS